MPRFPKTVYERGREPDPRFSLANERTSLAWVRTALALLGGGVALEALALPIEPHLRMVAALMLLTLGIAAGVQSYIGWARTELALRLGEELPGATISPFATFGVVVCGAVLLFGVLLR